MVISNMPCLLDVIGVGKKAVNILFCSGDFFLQ
jgi:hypothetical protein